MGNHAGCGKIQNATPYVLAVLIFSPSDSSYSRYQYFHLILGHCTETLKIRGGVRIGVINLFSHATQKAHFDVYQIPDGKIAEIANRGEIGLEVTVRNDDELLTSLNEAEIDFKNREEFLQFKEEVLRRNEDTIQWKPAVLVDSDVSCKIEPADVAEMDKIGLDTMKNFISFNSSQDDVGQVEHNLSSEVVLCAHASEMIYSSVVPEAPWTTVQCSQITDSCRWGLWLYNPQPAPDAAASVSFTASAPFPGDEADDVSSLAVSGREAGGSESENENERRGTEFSTKTMLAPSRLLILAFRGTDLSQNNHHLMTNIACEHRTILDDDSLGVHCGYECNVHNMYTSVKNSLRAEEGEESWVNTRFMVTGHSMGGGLAQIFAFRYQQDLERERERGAASGAGAGAGAGVGVGALNIDRVITFGAPMVLWQHGDELVSSRRPLRLWENLCTNYISPDDLVPLLPKLMCDSKGRSKLMSLFGPQMTSLYPIISLYIRNSLVDESLDRDLLPATFFRPVGATVLVRERVECELPRDRLAMYAVTARDFSRLIRKFLQFWFISAQNIAEAHSVRRLRLMIQRLTEL